MKKTVVFLLLLSCMSLLFLGCAKNNVIKTAKLVTAKETNASGGQKKESDKSKLYEIAFDAVWEMDKGLNTNIKYVSINTKTFKDFNEEDKKQLFEYIGKKYNVTLLDMSIDELKSAGYIKDLYFKDGIEFEINKYNSYTPDSVSFDGMKWCSGLGAIGFNFKAEMKNDNWELIKCGMTWIS